MRGDLKSRWVAIAVVGLMGLGVVSLRAWISADLGEGLDAEVREEVAEHDSGRTGGDEVVVIERLENPLFEALGGNYYLSGLYGDDLKEREEEYRRTNGGTPAKDQIADANLEWIKGRPDEAVRQWSKVIEQFGETAKESVDALARIGYAADQKVKRKSAIEERLEILGHPKPELFANLQKGTFQSGDPKLYRTCRELSDLFVEEGDPESARKFALLAYSRYASPNVCGTCEILNRRDIRWRIMELDAAMKRKIRVVLTSDLRMAAEYRGPRIPGLFVGGEIIDEGQTVVGGTIR